MAKPDFRALDSGVGNEVEDEDWSSEDIEAEVGGHKRRKGGKGGSRSHHNSSKSRQKKTAAVGDLEVAAQQEEAAVAELAPQAEAWKEKYTLLVQENETLKKRVEELMQQVQQARIPAPLLAAPLPSTATTAAVNTTPLELLNMPAPTQNGVLHTLPSFGTGLSIENPLPDAPAPGLEQLRPPQQQQQQQRQQ